MKGFGIEIKNDLLDPKHVQNMGQAVWLYMWLVDKMTSITEEGIGRVLGGKPITYDEVYKELGMSRNTYSRWIARLLEYPYIETTVAPHGITFRVLKAYKHFGKKTVYPQDTHTSKSGSPFIKSGSPQTGNHKGGWFTTNRERNKTVSRRDNTKDPDFNFFSRKKDLGRKMGWEHSEAK
jgi:hypothetical protein